MADSARPASNSGATSVPDRSSVDTSAVDIDIQRLLSGVILIQLRGSVDAGAAASLETELIHATLTGHPQPPCLLLDLSGVTFLDHAGLDAILHFQDRISAASGTVELLAPSPSVVRLLHEAELDGESWMTHVPDPPDPHSR
jgi:anti-anti-sigma factor